MEQRIESGIGLAGQRGGLEGGGIGLKGAGAGPPEKIRSFQVPAIEPGDHGGAPAVAVQGPETELVGAGEEKHLQHAFSAAFGIDEPFAAGAEVEGVGGFGLPQEIREGPDPAVVDGENGGIAGHAGIRCGSGRCRE